MHVGGTAMNVNLHNIQLIATFTTNHLVLSITNFQVTKYHAANRKASETQHCDTNQRLTYFNNSKTHSQISTYDRTFHMPEGYCSKLKRDDLQHTQVWMLFILIIKSRSLAMQAASVDGMHIIISIVRPGQGCYNPVR